MPELSYCLDPFHYQRRLSREVKVGRVGIGGSNPIRVQSMITCDTMDTEASIAQTMELAKAGCEIVRITAPTVKDAANLQHIVRGLRERGCDVPIVADIHFKPEAAMEAAKWVEKVRINPGNYADSKKFKIIEYTNEQYAAELTRIRQRFTPLVELCKERGIAMRIGTNHGSLSDRIMNRYGDTPLGMVESALEFARIARDLDYHAFIFSMKSSNPKVMIAAYRLLVARLSEEGPDWNYPLHLGVTEAGEGEDARIKSAIGIGSLLADGIGDTVRVSLTEDSIHEIPVARALAEIARHPERNEAQRNEVEGSRDVTLLVAPRDPSTSLGMTAGRAIFFDPFSYNRRATEIISVAAVCDCRNVTADNSAQPEHSNRSEDGGHRPLLQVRLGGAELVRVFIRREKYEKIAHKVDRMGDYKPEIIYENSNAIEIDPTDDEAIARVNASPQAQLVTVKDEVNLSVIAAFRLLAAKLQARHPILLKDTLSRHPERSEAESKDPVEVTLKVMPRDPSTSLGMTESLGGVDFLHTLLTASINIGSLLCDGIGDAILVRGEEAPGQSMRLSYNILQAAGTRIFKTDYVACPSCGRTLFNLQTTTARIKEATLHLKGVKIAIMGCIVNGPGEMADADFGYVGGAPGKVNLYVGKTPVKFNIPEAEAVERLKDLIREHGKWVEPVSSPLLIEA
jgi:(E)-4-hydroxy-3-methylbut-2-enyl-diphosphate synthase